MWSNLSRYSSSVLYLQRIFFKLSSHLFYDCFKNGYTIYNKILNYLGFIQTQGKDLYWSDNRSNLAGLSRRDLLILSYLYLLNYQEAQGGKKSRATQTGKKIPNNIMKVSQGKYITVAQWGPESKNPTTTAQNNQYLCHEEKFLWALLPLHGAHFCPPNDLWLQLRDSTYVTCYKCQLQGSLRCRTIIANTVQCLLSTRHCSKILTNFYNILRGRYYNFPILYMRKHTESNF